MSSVEYSTLYCFSGTSCIEDAELLLGQFLNLMKPKNIYNLLLCLWYLIGSRQARSRSSIRVCKGLYLLSSNSNKVLHCNFCIAKIERRYLEMGMTTVWPTLS